MIMKFMCAKQPDFSKLWPTANEGHGTVEISLDVSHPNFADKRLHQIDSSTPKSQIFPRNQLLKIDITTQKFNQLHRQFLCSVASYISITSNTRKFYGMQINRTNIMFLWFELFSLVLQFYQLGLFFNSIILQSYVFNFSCLNNNLALIPCGRKVFVTVPKYLEFRKHQLNQLKSFNKRCISKYDTTWPTTPNLTRNFVTVVGMCSIFALFYTIDCFEVELVPSQL